jgi:hypothetical protein
VIRRSFHHLVLILLLAPALHAQEPFGDSLGTLKQRFTIRQSSVSSVQKKGKPKEEIWEGVLQSSSLPPVVTLQVTLPVRGGRVVAPDGIAERIERMAALPFSVSWFKTLVEQHAGVEVIVHFETDRSLPPLWLRQFVDQMNQGTAEQKALGAEVAGAAAEVSFFQMKRDEDRWSRWIVFPDRRMVLWDYHGDGVLDGRVPACSLVPCRVGALASAAGRFP